MQRQPLRTLAYRRVAGSSAAFATRPMAAQRGRAGALAGIVLLLVAPLATRLAAAASPAHGVAVAVPAAADPAQRGATLAEILAASAPSDWRQADPSRTLYLELPQGRVVFELAPQFAPRHVANLRALVRERWFDGRAIDRVQDNFVVQWGGPGPGPGPGPVPSPRPESGQGPAAGLDAAGSGPRAARTLQAEFVRDWSRDIGYVALPDRDGYAADVGFADGFPVGGDRDAGKLWLAHCYGALAVGREEAVDSGSGAELYVVIGHAPRQLDRNATVLGRAIAGIERLSALPRGTAAMGFYASAAERVPIRSLRFADELPESARTPLELLRTDTETFRRVVEARRNRRDAWYVQPAGHIDLCSVPLPTRPARR